MRQIICHCGAHKNHVLRSAHLADLMGHTYRRKSPI
jgi:hypothetical protein